MVQLDWLHQMRHSRRQAFAGSQRRDSRGVAEILEPRCVLSGVMTAMPLTDAADIDDSTSLGEQTSQEASVQTTAESDPSAGFVLSAELFISPQAVESPYFSQAELRDYLLNLAQQQWSGWFGQTIPQYEYGNRWGWMEDDVVYAMDAAPMAGEVAVSSRVTSDTNTQVAGVDEADFVETDGRYLYVSRGGGLTILDTAGELSVASELRLSGNVVGEFLSGDRLTVITQSGFGGGWYGRPMEMMRVADSFAPWRWEPQTIVSVFDVTDRTAPSLVDQTTLDGSFRDARAVNGTVYVVLQNQFQLPEPLFTDTPVTDDGSATDEVLIDQGSDPAIGEVSVESRIAIPFWNGWNPKIIANRTYETFNDYVARVGDQITNLALPHALSLSADGETTDLGPLTGVEGIVRPQSDHQESLLSVVSFDAANASTGSGVADSASLLTSSGSTVYMTSDALYVATAEYNYDQWGYSSNTRIDRFTVAETNLEWQGSGVVSGTLINQFAMDEQDGYLHVATHTFAQHWISNDPTAENIDWSNGTWETQNDNGVFVLETQGDTLDEVGSLTGLAPGEQLYAARFIGNSAYLVTFLRTDPLFVIDLNDPANPTLQGELEIPGFSNYLQPVGDGQLIGLGQERVPGTWFSQLQVSLFNVTDGSSPQQIAREYLAGENGWGWSEAQYDHHALLYSSEDGLLVLPFAGSGTDPDGHWFYEQSLAVLHVDAVNGIETLGKIQTDESIIRTVRIDNVLYAISDSGVTAYSLEDLSAIGQADLFVSQPWYEPIAFLIRAGGGEPVAVNSSTGDGNSSDTGVVIVGTVDNTATATPADGTSADTAVATFIAMPSGAVGNDGFGGSVSISAVAAQVAQNTANNLARVGTPTLTPNAGLTSFDQNLIQNRLANSGAEDSSRRDRDDSSEASVESSNESDAPSFDAFWKEFTKRLRDGNEPMPMEDAASSNSETPMNVDKAASKTEAPTTRKATESRQTSGRTPEMSQRVRPAPRSQASVFTVKAVTKTSAVKSPMQTKPAR